MNIMKHDTATIKFCKDFRSDIDKVYTISRQKEGLKDKSDGRVFAGAALIFLQSIAKESDHVFIPEFDESRFLFAAQAHFEGKRIQYPPFN